MKTSNKSKESTRTSKAQGNPKTDKPAKMKVSKKPTTSSKKTKVIEKNMYESRMVKLIDEIEEKILDLKSQGRELTDTTRDKLSQHVETLTEKKSDLEHTLGEVKGTSVEKWHDFQKKADEKLEVFEKEAHEIFEGLGKGWKHLLSKFKKGQ